MHLHHPSLSLAGKKKGKKKFASADAKREYERLESEWADLKKKYSSEKSAKKNTQANKNQPFVYKLETPVGRTNTKHISSLNTGEVVAAAKPIPQYTGTEMIGIAIQHKSCLQPVFSQDSARDSASMRR